MDVTSLYILDLLRSGLTSLPCSRTGLIDWEKILHISQIHGISGLIYRAVRLSKGTVAPPDNILTSVKAQFLADIRLDRFQKAELSHLFSIFDENSIDYLPLKGTVMKDYYPSSELRTMSDADIMIRHHQYDKITDIVKKAGYAFIRESDHELKWVKQALTIEFHKVAFDPKYSDSADFFKNAFATASKIPGTCRFKLDPTDLLVYSTAHFAKHFVVGGARLRSLIDIRYLIGEGLADECRLNASLEALGLTGFYAILTRALDQWFNRRPFDNETELLFDTMMAESYEYNMEKGRTLFAARSFKGETDISVSRKTSFVIKRLFPSYHLMRQHYSILRKLPFLLPFFWIWRIISLLFKGKSYVRQLWNIQVKDTSNIVGAYMKDMKALHLDSIAVPEEIG